MTPSLRTLLTLTVAGLLLVPASGAVGSPPAERTGATYGAFAVNEPTGTVEAAYGEPTLARARAVAVERCFSAAGRPCRVVATVRGRCVSVALRQRADESVNVLGHGKGGTKRAAMRAARADGGPRTNRTPWLCTAG